MLPSFDLEPLPGEWHPVHGTEQARALEAELTRELTQGHELKGVTAEAVAVRRHLKDVVFWLPDTAEWAWVHLTYTIETNRMWPTAFVTTRWESLVEEITAD